ERSHREHERRERDARTARGSGAVLDARTARGSGAVLEAAALRRVHSTPSFRLDGLFEDRPLVLQPPRRSADAMVVSLPSSARRADDVDAKCAALAGASAVAEYPCRTNRLLERLVRLGREHAVLRREPVLGVLVQLRDHRLGNVVGTLAKRRRHAPDVRSARSGILDRDAIADVDLGLIADDDDLAGARVDGVLHAFTPALRAGRHGAADRGADQGVAD